MQSGQAQICAARSLPNPLTESYKGFWRKTETIAAKLQYDIIAFIRAYPQRISAVVSAPLRVKGIQILNLALYGTSRRIRAETVDLDDDALCLALQHTLVDKINSDDAAIYRADHTERHGRYSTPWIAKNHGQNDE